MAVRCRVGAAFSFQARSHHRAVPRGRHHRHRRAPRGAAHVRDAGAAGPGREPRRRGRHDRRRRRGQGGARRLHRADAQRHFSDGLGGRRARQSRDLQHRQRFRRHLDRRVRSAGHHRAPGRAGTGSGRISQIPAKRQERPLYLRLDRPGLVHARDRRSAVARDRHRDDPCAAERRGAAQAGAARRASPCRRRPALVVARRHQGGQAARARHQRLAPHPRAARRAHGARARLPGARGRQIERPVRAGEDAARGHRPAAEGNRSRGAPSGDCEALDGDRRSAGRLHAGRAGRNPATAGRAVQAGHPRNEDRELMKRLLLPLLFAWGSACGQTYPAKPVKLIVTYPPGGSSDLMARVFGAKLAEMWGQQVIVESKPGAAGSIGMDFAARQPPDGYSFVIGNSGPVAINPLLSSVPYSIEKDFVAVSMISSGPNVLVVRADSPHKSLADVISFARENPGMLNYGTSGPGSISHLSSEMLKSLTRVQAVEVPYKGGVLAVQDLLGDQIHFIFSDTLPAMQHIRAGKLRALCITGAEPFALLPDLSTCQSEVPGLVALNWWGVLMPAGTPRAIVAKFHGDTVKALADNEIRKRFADLGGVAMSSTPEQFSAFIRAETDKYAKLIKEANIKVNP